MCKGMEVTVPLDTSVQTYPKSAKKIRTQVRVSNVIDVNTVQGYAQVECTIRSYWPIEKEVADKYPKKSKITEEGWTEWHPDLIIHNKFEGELAPSYFVKEKVNKENDTVTYEVEQKLAFFGSISNYSDLHDFPFDCNWLMIYVRSETYDSDELIIEWDNALHSEKIIGHPTATGAMDWEIGLPDYSIDILQRGASGKQVCSIQVKIPLRRIASFFIWKILLVLCITYAMSWAAFGFDPQDFADRVNVNIAVTFSQVALLFVMSGFLPKVPYLTFVDKCMLFSFVLLGLSIIENYIVYVHQDAADVIDTISMVIFPTFFLSYVITQAYWRYRRASTLFVSHPKPQQDIFEGRKTTPYFLLKKSS